MTFLRKVVITVAITFLGKEAVAVAITKKNVANRTLSDITRGGEGDL